MKVRQYTQTDSLCDVSSGDKLEICVNKCSDGQQERISHLIPSPRFLKIHFSTYVSYRPALNRDAVSLCPIFAIADM